MHGSLVFYSVDCMDFHKHWLPFTATFHYETLLTRIKKNEEKKHETSYHVWRGKKEEKTKEHRTTRSQNRERKKTTNSIPNKTGITEG